MREEYKQLLLSNENISAMNNKKLLITGATGLLGNAFLEFIYYLNHNEGYNIVVDCLIRDLSKVSDRFKKELNFNWITNYDECINKYDFIMHFACPTHSKTFINDTVSVLDYIYNSTKKLLEISKNCNSTFVYMSSIEAYGEISSEFEINEDINSSINSSNIRSCYPIGKILSENMAFAYNSQYGVNIRVIRLTQILAASKNDNRFISYLVNSVLNKQEISLNTYGKTSKSFCYILDAISAIITIMIKGNNTIYNVANPNIKMSIYDIANYVSNKYLNKDVSINIKDNCGYPNDTKIYLNVDKLLNIGWKPIFDLSKSFDLLVKTLNNNDNK